MGTHPLLMGGPTLPAAAGAPTQQQRDQEEQGQRPHGPELAGGAAPFATIAFLVFRDAARICVLSVQECSAHCRRPSQGEMRDNDGDVVEGAAASGRSRGPELVEGERAAVGDVVEPPAQRLRAGGGLTRRAG